MKFNEKLQLLRKQKGLSQEDLANELDVSRQSVFKWESGENTPDISKLKKLSSLFEVSIDFLLDDNVNFLSDENKQNNKKSYKYRSVFDSEIKLESDTTSDMENAYIEGIIQVNEEIIKSELDYYEQLCKNRSDTKRFPIQKYLNAFFFFDDNTKYFGVFFDGAEQFACPYENFINMVISDSGDSFAQGSELVGGVGVGLPSTVFIGSMPTITPINPIYYSVIFNYFGEDNNIKSYSLKLSSFRFFPKYCKQSASQEQIEMFVDDISISTRNNLAKVKGYLEGVKLIGDSIKNNNSVLPNICAEEKEQCVLKGQEHKKFLIKSLENEIAKYKRKFKISFFIIGIFTAILVIIGVIIALVNFLK